MNQVALAVCLFLSFTGMAAGGLITVSKTRSTSRCCSGGNVMSCLSATVDLNELGSSTLELPGGEVLSLKGNIAGDSNAYYYENGLHSAVITYSPASNGLHGSVTSQGNYALENCGAEGHAWKQLDASLTSKQDAIMPPTDLFEQIHRENHTALVDQGIADTTTVVWYSIKFYYTPQFAATTADIDGFIDQAIAETNAGYYWSEIPLRAYKLCHERATINDNWDGNYMLNSFSAMKPEAQLRDGADAAALLIQDFGLCGIAWLDTIWTGRTFSVTKKACAVGIYVLAHEIGHNIGAHHDPATSYNNIYPYGHGHLIQAGNGYGGARTIMSYSRAGHETVLNYWSNPNLYNQYTGTVMGVTGLSNNARLLTENRFSLAAIGSENSPTCVYVPPPTTTTRPVTTTTKRTTTTTKRTTTTTKRTTTTTKTPTTTTTTPRPSECTKNNTATKPYRIARKKRSTSASCSRMCKNRAGCVYWKWQKSKKLCFVYGIKFVANSDFVSGVYNCNGAC